MRTVLYARVSSKHRQGDNFSIDTQLEAMRQYAQQQGFEVVAELTEKDSAFKNGLERSELNKALELARTGQITSLMFFSPDRFTRDMADGIILRRELYRLKVKLFCFLPSPHEITNEAELINVLNDWQGQQYVEKLREACMRGYEGKVKKGLFSQGLAPYGYRLVGRKEDTHLEIVEERAQVVRQMFDWHINGMSTLNISRKLTEASVATPGEVLSPHKRKRNPGEWSIHTVYDILRNETYAGTWYAFTFKRIATGVCVPRPREEWLAINVPAIVSRDVWEESQRRLTAKAYPRNVKRQYLMRARVTCGCCGYSMQARTKTSTFKRTNRTVDYGYYMCNTKNGNMVRPNCGTPGFAVDAVDNTVWQWVKELANDPDKVLHDYRTMQQQTQGQHAGIYEQLNVADEKIAEYTRLLDGVLEARITGKYPAAICDRYAEEYGTALTALRQKRVTLAEQLAETAITNEEIARLCEFVETVRRDIPAIEQSNDFLAKRAIIERLNLRVTLRVDNEGEKWVNLQWMVYSIPLSISGLMISHSTSVASLAL